MGICINKENHISNFERNMHIDIKIIFGYKQHRVKIVEEKKSMMAKKWFSPERESIADSVSLV